MKKYIRIILLCSVGSIIFSIQESKQEIEEFGNQEEEVMPQNLEESGVAKFMQEKAHEVLRTGNPKVLLGLDANFTIQDVHEKAQNLLKKFPSDKAKKILGLTTYEEVIKRIDRFRNKLIIEKEAEKIQNNKIKSFREFGEVLGFSLDNIPTLAEIQQRYYVIKNKFQGYVDILKMLEEAYNKFATQEYLNFVKRVQEKTKNMNQVNEQYKVVEEDTTPLVNNDESLSRTYLDDIRDAWDAFIEKIQKAKFNLQKTVLAPVKGKFKGGN